jgi:glycine/D-amino acid oxidase-like deaminating enzyme
LWLDTLDPALPARPALRHDIRADVAIVGAGFTGLWTAYYLTREDPTLTVVLLEREHAGFGASGRNGGWCSALFSSSWEKLARFPGASRESARALAEAMRGAVSEIGRVCHDDGIDADFAQGGTIVLARSRAQARRARAEVASAAEWGTDLRWLDAGETRARLNATGVLGSTLTGDCAALHPGKLVRGLASIVARRASLYEHTTVRAIEPGRVRTDHGTVTAGTIIRATEGYTPTLAGHRRRIAPVYSLVIATEPLTDRVWNQIGLRARETFSDHRHLIIYGQRTADGRLVFGGRGAPYHFGSRIRPDYDRNQRVFASLYATLLEIFTVLAGTRITHAWGGPLGVSRDWCASVGLGADGIGWAGGYVGDGVSTTNLAGRTLTDLVLSRDTDLTRLPWVGHRSPSWEPEPLRWLGTNLGLRLMSLADREEQLSGRPSLVARAMAPLLGGH